MELFPRTTVGGVSLSRLVIGTNWFFGYSHTSAAKDKFIRSVQDRKRIADILEVFFRQGVDTVIGGGGPAIRDAMKEAEDRTGRAGIMIATPMFNILPGGPPGEEPEPVFDRTAAEGTTLCMPHQCITDALVDRMHREIRNIDTITAMIRERGMVPGLSTHMPETVLIADETDADIETYIQIYNAAGFLMQVETDWVMRIIRNAKKPVLTIKPLAAGRVMPPVGLAFVWNTIRECDLVAIGTSSPDEAREVIDLSLDFLDRRLPMNELQRTRSKRLLDADAPGVANAATGGVLRY